MLGECTLRLYGFGSLKHHFSFGIRRKDPITNTKVPNLTWKMCSSRIVYFVDRPTFILGCVNIILLHRYSLFFCCCCWWSLAFSDGLDDGVEDVADDVGKVVGEHARRDDDVGKVRVRLLGHAERHPVGCWYPQRPWTRITLNYILLEPRRN